MSAERIDVAVVGDNTIDRFLDEPDLGDLVGGNALNVAVHLALTGLRVGYFGAVGTDENAGVIRRAIQFDGLDLTGLRVWPGATALTTIRRDAGGDRRFDSEDFGVTADYFPGPGDLARIGAASWVHVGMLPRARELGEYLARTSTARVSQDCSVSPEHDRLEVKFLSAGDDESVADALIQCGLANGAQFVVATLGADGVLAGDRDQRWRLPGDPIDVVDTTGAGDSFMAGFIAARVRGSDVDTSLRAGANRGGFTCRYTGGWPQLASDVATFLPQ